MTQPPCLFLKIQAKWFGVGSILKSKTKIPLLDFLNRISGPYSSLLTSILISIFRLEKINCISTDLGIVIFTQIYMTKSRDFGWWHLIRGKVLKRLLNWLTFIGGAQVTAGNHFTVLSLESIAQFWATILTGPFTNCSDLWKEWVWWEKSEHQVTWKIAEWTADFCLREEKIRTSPIIEHPGTEVHLVLLWILSGGNQTNGEEL